MSERIQEIIKELRSMQNAAQVVLDSGFGTHEGEHDTVYRKRRNLAKDAADIIETLLRETEPNPLTVEQIKEREGKPVYDAGGCAWRIVEGVEYVDELCSIVHFTDSDSVNLEDHPLALYATEPKGEATT